MHCKVYNAKLQWSRIETDSKDSNLSTTVMLSLYSMRKTILVLLYKYLDTET